MIGVKIEADSRYAVRTQVTVSCVVCKSSCRVVSTGCDQRLQQCVRAHACDKYREGDLVVRTSSGNGHDISLKRNVDSVSS